MSEEEKQEKKFEVKDKRRFTGEGDQRGTAESPKESSTTATTEEASSKEPEAVQGKAGGEEAQPAKEEKPPADLPPINFATFVVSLSSSVLIHLGLAPDPISGEARKELPLAKQTIDILSMIQEKTKGNLSKEEGQLMESILYDLRMRYVEEAKKG